MHAGILRNPLFAARLKAPRPSRSEPQLVARRVAQPIDSPRVAGREASIAPENDERTPLPPPATLIRGSSPVTITGLPVGSLLYLGLVGLVAAVISTSFGASFFLLAAPANKSIVASERNPALPAQRVSAPGPIALEAGSSPAHGVAATPDLAPQDNIAPIPSSNMREALLPPAAETAPSTPTALRAGQAENPSASGTVTAPGSSTSAGSSISKDDTIANPGSISAGYEHAAHPRTTARRAYHRSSGESRSSGPQQSRSPRSLTPSQAERAGSFGRLLTHMTSKTKTFDETLTPPAAGTTSPYAARAAQ
jgi:hypothetical protein